MSLLVLSNSGYSPVKKGYRPKVVQNEDFSMFVYSQISLQTNKNYMSEVSGIDLAFFSYSNTTSYRE